MNYWNTPARQAAAQDPPADPYLRQAADFCRHWLDGQSDFTLKTSGSTGPPKLIHLSRARMLASARLTASALSLRAGHGRALVCLHVGYIAGMMMLVRGLMLDWHMTVVPPVANPLNDLPEDAAFDLVALVPLQMEAMLNDAQSRRRLVCCGTILLGGAPVSEALERTIRELPVPVYQTYGMTETVSHVALRRLNGPAPQSNYHVLDGIDYGIDTRGCLWLKGEVTDFDVVQTNDRVELLPERQFAWVGRADAVINSGGIKIDLDNVDRSVGAELATREEPIPDYFSWYQRDDMLGQKLVLFVAAPATALDASMLLQKLSGRLTRYEIPKAVYFVPNLLRAPTGKIDRRATADRFYSTIK